MAMRKWLDRSQPLAGAPGLRGVDVAAAEWRQGALDLAALERSLNAIIERHEALRTTFSSVDGEAVQVVAPALRVHLPFIDFSTYPEAEREAKA